MKIVLVVAVFALTLISAEPWSAFRQKLIGYMADCKESSDVDIKFIKKALYGEFVDDPNYVIFVHCFAQKLNIMDSEGNFKDPNILSNLMDNAKIAIKNCEVEADKETGNGKRSFVYFKCLHRSFSNNVDITKNVLE